MVGFITGWPILVVMSMDDKDSIKRAMKTIC
jgi:hypothetical protein